MRVFITLSIFYIGVIIGMLTNHVVVLNNNKEVCAEVK